MLLKITDNPINETWLSYLFEEFIDLLKRAALNGSENELDCLIFNLHIIISVIRIITICPVIT